MTKRGLASKVWRLTLIEPISLATGYELERLDSAMNLVCLPVEEYRKFGSKTKPQELLKQWHRVLEEKTC